MEFHVNTAGWVPDIDAIVDMLQAVDPSALADIDSSGSTLRIAAAVDAGELLALFTQSGFTVDKAQVIQLPSICCGGCGG